MTCAKQTVFAVIVCTDGRLVAGSNRCETPQLTCPRLHMGTGEGYWMCKDVCNQHNHAEVDALMAAGNIAAGGTLYLVGHTYVCDDCQEAIDAAGIERVVILEERDA